MTMEGDHDLAQQQKFTEFQKQFQLQLVISFW